MINIGLSCYSSKHHYQLQVLISVINWDLAVDTIQSEKCILFLGPEVFTNHHNETLEQRLHHYLALENNAGNKVYSDGLFFFKERQKRTEVYLKIRRFFEQESFPEAEKLFAKIAKIPFHFIVTITPDNLLLNTFQDNMITARSDFYQKQPGKNNTKTPTRNAPLIYNLLGNVNKPSSLVLTHDDLYDYFESIFQRRSMSEQLKSHILNEAQSIIFLGIPFDKWYLQLLLRVLHLHKDEEFMRFAAAQEVEPSVQTFCKEQFKINFVPFKVEDVINEIYQRFERNNSLRTPSTTERSFIEQLIDKLALDKFEEVLSQFHDWLEDIGEPGENLLDDVILLKNRNRRLKRKIDQGILSQSESTLEGNKLRSTLLNLLNEGKNL